MLALLPLNKYELNAIDVQKSPWVVWVPNFRSIIFRLVRELGTNTQTNI